jgi:hypothetical protein
MLQTGQTYLRMVRSEQTSFNLPLQISNVPCFFEYFAFFSLTKKLLGVRLAPFGKPLKIFTTLVLTSLLIRSDLIHASPYFKIIRIPQISLKGQIKPKLK